MKKRLISAAVALIIFIPTLIMGGNVFAVAIYLLSLLALHELIKIKETKKELPTFISFVTYIVMSLLVLSNITNSKLMFMVDYRVVVGFFMVFLIPTVLYHDRSKYSIVDAFYLIGSIFFLGFSFSLMITLRNIDLTIVIYLFLISIITDSYAYIVGKLIGKNKLLVDISPKKTWEGSIGGTVFGTFIATVFYINFISYSSSIWIIIFMTMFLSILGQFGDLVFSAIKRYYGKKDFSNIMPGHGGILDRLDSIIFIVLGYMFFISII